MWNDMLFVYYKFKIEDYMMVKIEELYDIN